MRRLDDDTINFEHLRTYLLHVLQDVADGTPVKVKHFRRGWTVKIEAVKHKSVDLDDSLGQQ